MKDTTIIDSMNYIFKFGRYKKNSLYEVFQGNGKIDSDLAFRLYIKHLNECFEPELHLNDMYTGILEDLYPINYENGFFITDAENTFIPNEDSINRYLNIMPIFNKRNFGLYTILDTIQTFSDYCHYSKKIRIHYSKEEKLIPQGDPSYINWLMLATKDIAFTEEIMDSLESTFYYKIDKVSAEPIQPGKYKLDIDIHKEKYVFSNSAKEKNLKKLKNL